MFTFIKNAFADKDTRRRIFFTLFVFAVFRLRSLKKSYICKLKINKIILDMKKHITFGLFTLCMFMGFSQRHEIGVKGGYSIVGGDAKNVIRSAVDRKSVV